MSPTVIDAKFSLQHSAATALLRDRPALADFEPTAIKNPAITALRQRVTVKAAEPFVSRYPGRFGAAVKVTLADGGTVEATVDDAWGDPENPMTDAALLDKARMLMGYAGVAREGMGDAARALSNYQEAVQIDKNFTPAKDARDRLQAVDTTAAPAGNG